ncbi:glycosyltransferase [Bacillus sp. FJAT-29937]|uniref:glycosyltransferase n=1 Tax=Bacillus sp. FJAT-29937 TaxID=1720553 RepID=UPI000831819D|nr:glycosyltransferase [Bacillus sp. FJAT-29937]
MIKVLFITRDFSQYVERNTFYLTNELRKWMDVIEWFEPGDIHEILRKIREKPDFILLNDLRDSRCPAISGLSTLKIPFGIIMHDLHWEVEKRKKFIEESKVKYIFSIYRDPFLRKFPEYRDRMYWLPHFFNPAIFKDYHLKKDIDYLLLGKMASYYPLRKKIVKTMKGIPGFVYREHPGYRNISEGEEKALVGDNYAREINRAKIFFTCDSTLHYPIIKYYEVLACNTLLLAPSLKELTDLGFIPGQHFVEINKDNFLEKAKYYLDHEEDRKQIARTGYEMVHKNHTVSIRAVQLVSYIKKILGKLA